MTTITRTRHVGMTVVSIFAIIAGLGEVVVGFKGNYLGILSKDIRPSISTALIGAFYSLGCLSLLTMKKWGAALGILFISAEILGRVYLVMAIKLGERQVCIIGRGFHAQLHEQNTPQGHFEDCSGVEVFTRWAQTRSGASATGMGRSGNQVGLPATTGRRRNPRTIVGMGEGL